MSEKRILVVDDAADLRKMLGLVLSKNGYEVSEAADGQEALVASFDEHPDLILLDIMMKDMDGWEVLKLLKMDEATRDIPVVIISARTEPKDKIRGLQEGAVDYVTKPFVVRDVLDRIARILGSEGVA